MTKVKMSPSPLPNLMVIGVSGVMAPELIDYLAELGTYNVSVLCRPTSSTAGLPSGVEVFRSDFTYDSLVQVLRGKQLVVDMIAVMPIQDKMRLIDAIVDAGVERLIPGEFSSNMDNPVMRALWSVHADRITVRDYLKLKASQTPSFSWTAVAVGPFYEWALTTGFMRFSFDTKTATIFDDGSKPFCTTTLARSCEIVHAIFQHLGVSENKVLYSSSFTTNQNQVLKALEDATNAVWTVNRTTTNETIARARQRIADGDVKAQMDLLMAAIYAPQFGSDWTEAAKETNRLLELKAEDMRQVTQEVVDRKRPKKGIFLGLLEQYS